MCVLCMVYSVLPLWSPGGMIMGEIHVHVQCTRDSFGRGSRGGYHLALLGFAKKEPFCGSKLIASYSLKSPWDCTRSNLSGFHHLALLNWHKIEPFYASKLIISYSLYKSPENAPEVISECLNFLEEHAPWPPRYLQSSGLFSLAPLGSISKWRPVYTHMRCTHTHTNGAGRTMWITSCADSGRRWGSDRGRGGRGGGRGRE